MPNPLAGPLILQAIRETGGAAVVAGPDETSRAQADAGRLAGLAPCAEAAVALAAIPHLVRRGVVARDERVVVVLTGDRTKDP